MIFNCYCVRVCKHEWVYLWMFCDFYSRRKKMSVTQLKRYIHTYTNKRWQIQAIVITGGKTTTMPTKKWVSFMAFTSKLYFIHTHKLSHSYVCLASEIYNCNECLVEHTDTTTICVCACLRSLVRPRTQIEIKIKTMMFFAQYSMPFHIGWSQCGGEQGSLVPVCARARTRPPARSPVCVMEYFISFYFILLNK